MTQDEFWQTSPEVFAALSKRWGERIHREASHFAALMALTYNVNRGKDEPALTAKDFLRNKDGSKRRGPSRKQRAKEAARFFAGLVAEGLARSESV